LLLLCLDIQSVYVHSRIDQLTHLVRGGIQHCTLAQIQVSEQRFYCCSTRSR